MYVYRVYILGLRKGGMVADFFAARLREQYIILLPPSGSATGHTADNFDDAIECLRLSILKIKMSLMWRMK